MIQRIHSARKGSGGQALVFTLLTVFVLVAFIALTVNLSELMFHKIRMQSAADAAALSAAVWQARCLNLIAVLNIGISAAMAAIVVMIILIALSKGALIPTLSPKIARLYRVARKMGRVQDTIKAVCPLLVEAETYRIARKNEALGALVLAPSAHPFPGLLIHRLGAPDFNPSSSWHVKRDGKQVTKHYSGSDAAENTRIPLPYMRDDDFESGQQVLSIAVRLPDRPLMHAQELFGFENPRLLDMPEIDVGSRQLSGDIGMVTIAQARPFNSDEPHPLLLVPQWRARLTAVSLPDVLGLDGMEGLQEILRDAPIHH